jgi:hypothetical protein
MYVGICFDKGHYYHFCETLLPSYRHPTSIKNSIPSNYGLKFVKRFRADQSSCLSIDSAITKLSHWLKMFLTTKQEDITTRMMKTKRWKWDSFSMMKKKSFGFSDWGQMESHTAKVPSCSSFSTSFPESF